MEYIQWKTSGSKDKGVKEPTNWTHWVILRFNKDDRGLDKFDETFTQAAENFKFEYNIKSKEQMNPDESKAMFHSEDLNEALNMAMKMFEVYLTIRNQ